MSTSPDSQCIPATLTLSLGRLVGAGGRDARCRRRRRAAGAGCRTCRRRRRPRCARAAASRRRPGRGSRPPARRASAPARARPRARRAPPRRTPSAPSRPRVAASSAASGACSSRLCRIPKPPPRSATRGVQPSASRHEAANDASRTIVSACASKSASCEPTWTWSPSTSSPRASASSTSARACAGGSPNFEPWWPVRIASCVSASTPSVTRTSTRRTPAAAASSASSGASSTTAAPSAAASRQERLVLVVPVHDELGAGEAGGARERELARGSDVGPDPLRAQQPQHRDVGEGLRPEGDVPAGGRRLQRARPRAQRLLAVDDERRPVLGRELGGVRRRRGQGRSPRRAPCPGTAPARPRPLRPPPLGRGARGGGVPLAHVLERERLVVARVPRLPEVAASARAISSCIAARAGFR